MCVCVWGGGVIKICGWWAGGGRERSLVLQQVVFRAPLLLVVKRTCKPSRPVRVSAKYVPSLIIGAA